MCRCTGHCNPYVKRHRRRPRKKLIELYARVRVLVGGVIRNWFCGRWDIHFYDRYRFSFF